jgi:hypothetical protein
VREGEEEGAEAFGVHGGKVLDLRCEVQGSRFEGMLCKM